MGNRIRSLAGARRTNGEASDGKSVGSEVDCWGYQTRGDEMAKSAGNIRDSKMHVDPRLATAIEQGFREKHPVLIDALPAMGKSSGIIEWAATTGNPLSVFTARRELYAQLETWSRELGLNPMTLPTFHADCETANGTHGTEWQNRVNKIYREKGLLPGELHKQAEELFGEQLPCQQEGDCTYYTARDFDPADYDVLIGHYRHAHVPDRVKDRYVAFDEFPEDEFLTEYSANQVTTAVSAFLDAHDDLPFQYLRDLKEYRRDPEQKQQGIAWFEKHNPTLKRDISSTVENKNRNAHPQAALMTYAILVAEDLENRWEYAQLPEDRTAVLNPENGSLTVLSRPALDGAESVIALDGTPTVAKWKLMLGNDLKHRPVLTDDEKRQYLRETLRIKVVQTTEAAKPYSGGTGISLTPEQDLVLFERVAHIENTSPALITSKRALEEYERLGLSEILDATEHYGNLKGSNQFKSTRVGIVAGSPHYGDTYIQKWSALAGESAQIVLDERGIRTKGMEQDFGPYGNKILRGFRENEVLQAIMRFGRDAGGATVYVHTAALPEWVERSARVSEIRKWPKGMDEILAAINATGKTEWRTKEITEKVSISPQQTRKHLHTLCDFGFISVRREGRGFTWSDTNLGEIGTRGHIVVDEPPKAV